MSSEKLYADWLYERVIDDDFEWQLQPQLSFSEFQKKYTLHDSFWVGLFHCLSSSPSCTLAFQWDSHWLPDDVKKNNAPVDDWPYLFIKLESISSIENQKTEDLEGTNKAISDFELVSEGGNSCLVIDDVFGGSIKITFTGGYSFLALTSNNVHLKI